jgi:hypothetical protein
MKGEAGTSTGLLIASVTIRCEQRAVIQEQAGDCDAEATIQPENLTAVRSARVTLAENR